MLAANNTSAVRAALLLLALCLPTAAQEPTPVHDADNPARAMLQDPKQALQGLPLDKRGSVDWALALRSGAISPRENLDGSARSAPLDLDVVLKNTKEMPYVRFPHRLHTEHLACSNCHDGLFVPKAGANRINMELIFKGEACGACHGRVAFVAHLACERCHSIARDGAKPWW